jgi:hypothetical protein
MPRLIIGVDITDVAMAAAEISAGVYPANLAEDPIIALSAHGLSVLPVVAPTVFVTRPLTLMILSVPLLTPT